jgi:hypothetical protein
MKFLVLGLLASSASLVPQLAAAQLKDVKSVYLYPMPGGFEQILASRIVTDHVYNVVSDPKLADAIFTDQINDFFLYKLDHIQTPPPPVNNSGSTSTMTADTTPHASSFTRGRGTLFLVDAKSKQVVWSIYAKPADNSSATLNKTAIKVVNQLEVANGMKPVKH